jgi:hypothetical protein
LDVDAVTGTVVGRVERHLLGEVSDTIERLTWAGPPNLNAMLEELKLSAWRAEAKRKHGQRGAV